MSDFARFIKRLGLSTARLTSPPMLAEQQREDMNPQNFQAIDQEMAGAKNATQRNTLSDERQRLQQVHLQQMQAAAQQFAPRLQQALDLPSHTGMPPPVPTAIKLMMRMRTPLQPGANPSPQQPMPDMLGGVRG